MVEFNRYWRTPVARSNNFLFGNGVSAGEARVKRRTSYQLIEVSDVQHYKLGRC